jgi:hypothetical protein
VAALGSEADALGAVTGPAPVPEPAVAELADPDVVNAGAAKAPPATAVAGPAVDAPADLVEAKAGAASAATVVADELLAALRGNVGADAAAVVGPAPGVAADMAAG